MKLKTIHLRAALFFAVALTAATATAQQQRKADITTAPYTSAVYQVGERLTYNVSYSQLPTAATVELSVVAAGTYENRSGVELRARVETTELVSASLFSLDNEYVSIIDPQTGLPFRAQQILGRSDAPDAPGFEAPSLPIALGPNVFDLVSALYRLRALPALEGAAYHLSVAGGSEQYEAEIKADGRELIKTSVGTFNAVAISVRVPSHKRADDYRLRVYLSDDAKRLPVLITARLKSGELRAELASATVVNEGTTVPAATPTAPAPARPTPAPPVIADNSLAPPADSPPTGLPFSIGEQLNYQVFLGTGPQPVASLSYQVRQRARYFGRLGLLLSGSAQTTNAGQRFFVVNDQINSYVDPTSLLPFRTETKLQEGRRRRDVTLSLDQDRGTATSDKNQRIDIPVGTHDLVSTFYALRSFDLRRGKRNAVSIIINNRPRTLFIDFVQNETITVSGQTIPAIQLTLATDDSQGDRYSVKMWVGADSRRLPLRITATTPLGPVRADLALLPGTIR